MPLKRLAQHLPRGSFVRNVGLLAGGTAFAQGLAVLALPFLTRLYTPEEFALLSVYVSTVGILTVVAALRFNIAIPIPEQDAEGLALLGVSLTVTTAISLLLALVSLAFPSHSAQLLGQPEMEPFLWMIPLGVFAGSSYNALQYWASRKKRFARITHTRISRAVGGIGTQLVLGITKSSPFGLIFGHMLYSGLGSVSLFRSIARYDRHLLSELSTLRLLAIAKAYQRYPLWSVPEALFNTGGIQLPIIIIAATAAGPEAGFLLLAMRVVSLPMGLIGTSVSQVYFAHAPDKHRNGQLRQFTQKTMFSLFKVGFAPLAILAAISPTLFPIVFGQQWERAGWLVSTMVPLALLQFVTSPVSMVLHVVNRQRTAMILQTYGFVLRVSAIVIAARLFPGWLAEFYIASGIILYVTYFLVVNMILRVDKTEIN